MTFLKNNSFFLLLIGLTATTLLFTSCDKDDDAEPTDPQELITTVLLNISNDAGDTDTFAFRDTDGAGGNAPVVDQIVLDANTVYKVEIEFKDESNASDIEDITLEVKEEDLEHLVCFATTGVIDIPVTIDTDAAGQALGLENQLTTTDAGNATLTIVLKHEPNKSSSDACNTGETDVEATFEVRVE